MPTDTIRDGTFGSTMKAAAMRLFVSLVILLPLFTGGFATVAFLRPRSQLWLGRNLGALYELVDENELPLVATNLADTNHTDDFTDDRCLVDFGNFWRKTRANFTTCELPDRSPDFKSKGSGGSKYWDMGDHVVRHANHWSGQHGIGRIVDCEWTLDMSHRRKNMLLVCVGTMTSSKESCRHRKRGSYGTRSGDHYALNMQSIHHPQAWLMFCFHQGLPTWISACRLSSL